MVIPTQVAVVAIRLLTRCTGLTLAIELSGRLRGYGWRALSVRTRRRGRYAFRGWLATRHDQSVPDHRDRGLGTVMSDEEHAESKVGTVRSPNTTSAAGLGAVGAGAIDTF